MENEELTTPVPAETPETEPVAAAEPDAAPAPASDPDLAAREAAIAKRERELQTGFEKLARKQRETEQPATPAEPAPELDEDAARAVDARVQAQYGHIFSAVETMFQETLRTELNSAAQEHGVEVDALQDTIREYGLQPADASAEARKAVYDRAAKLVKSSAFDPDAERNRLKEEVLQQLAEQGVRIEAIRPGRPDPEAAEVDPYSDNVSPQERYRALKAKQQG